VPSEDGLVLLLPGRRVNGLGELRRLRRYEDALVLVQHLLDRRRPLDVVEVVGRVNVGDDMLRCLSRRTRHGRL